VVTGVGGPVAVVVDVVVADFVDTGVDVCVGIVAIGQVFDVSLGRSTVDEAVRLVAVAVTVHVGVPVDVFGVRVGFTVAVVVDEIVTDLDGAGVHVCFAVVAVVGVADVPFGVLHARSEEIFRVAVAVTVRVCVPGDRSVGVVDDAVAVLVDAVVTDLHPFRVDRRIAVVAVIAVVDVARGLVAGLLRVCEVAVAIGVDVCVPGGDVLVIDPAVAVVVVPVADFDGVWVDEFTGVVAVAIVVDEVRGGRARSFLCLTAEAVLVDVVVPDGGLSHVLVAVVAVRTATVVATARESVLIKVTDRSLQVADERRDVATGQEDQQHPHHTHQVLFHVWSSGLWGRTVPARDTEPVKGPLFRTGMMK